jgi:hypothetical protein
MQLNVALLNVTGLAAFVLIGLVGAAGWGCSSSSSPPAARGDDASAEVDAGTDCGFAKPQNEAGCPATYDTASLPPACSPIGLQCLYPGQGDGAGCTAATAALFCVASGVDAGAGGDAGAQGRWGGAQ